MTKTSFFLFCLVAICVAGCSTKPKEGFRLEGKLLNVKPGTKVYLDQLSLSNSSITDTTTLNNEGAFKLHGFVKEESLYRLRYGNNVILLVLDEKPSDIYLEADTVNPFIKPYVIKGSPKTSILYSLFKRINERSEEINQLKAQIDSGSTLSDSAREVVQSRISEIHKATHDYLVKFCDTVNSPVLSVFAVASFLQREMTTLTMIGDNLGKRFPQSSIVKEFNAKLKSSAQNPNMPKQKFQDGEVLPDIVAEGVDGSTKKLSSLHGQYVLVDFWASWCGPCRGENPNVVAMYQQYKNKGFNIFSVSLDNDKDKWQQAIQQDKLVWSNHVSDLKGWKSDVCSTFDISSIPTNYLIDKDGKVIGFNLRGAELKAKLGEIFK